MVFWNEIIVNGRVKSYGDKNEWNEKDLIGEMRDFRKYRSYWLKISDFLIIK